MKKYRVQEVLGTFGIFLDEEIEAEDSVEAKEMIMQEIIDNIGNYVEIELEDITNEEEYFEDEEDV